MNNYKRKHCKKIVKRDSNKQWIKSYCTTTDKEVHLILYKGFNPITHLDVSKLSNIEELVLTKNGKIK